MNALKHLKHVVSLAAAAGALTCASCSNHRATPSSTATAAPPTPVVTATADGHLGTDDHPSPTAPAMADAASVAEQFAKAWVAPTEDATEWRDGLRPLSEPSFARALETADPNRRSARRILGKPDVTRDDGHAWLHANIPTDNGVLVLTIAPIDGRWLISDIDIRRSTS